MTDLPVTVTPLATYRNERQYPFCPGCGHGPILDRLNAALVTLGRDPRQIVIVSDIGCSGLSDQYFSTNAFHGLHGRSITYASGIKLARPELDVIVVMGDGGTGIGGAHLLSAARRNIGITVLVFNNFNFGMTGGQHSTTTPTGMLTSTTPFGNLERPLDVCATVAVNGAAFVYRGTSFDQDLAERIAEGVRHEGFSLFDIWELCTAYYVPKNHLSKKSLYSTLDDLGFATGVLRNEAVAELAHAYRTVYADQIGEPVLAPDPIDPAFTSRLERPFRVVVAGAAGGRVGSAVRLVAGGAIRSGLWAAQRTDYPVTVKTGHSVAELILSPDPIEYAGIDLPDVLVILSPEGRNKSAGYLSRMDEHGAVFVLPDFADVDTRARVEVIDPARAPDRLPKTCVALALVAAVVERFDLYPLDAMVAGLRDDGSDATADRRAIAAGRALATGGGFVAGRS